VITSRKKENKLTVHLSYFRHVLLEMGCFNHFNRYDILIVNHTNIFIYLASISPASNLVNVAIDGAREVDGEGVALAVSRRKGRHLKK
jgi:hypothetical protein